MHSSLHTSTETVRSIRNQMTALRSLPLMAVLSLFLLFAQSVEHGHSHDELQAQFDCEICLKVGSLEDVVLADAPSLSFAASHQPFSILIQNQTSSTRAAATARGPPSYT